MVPAILVFLSLAFGTAQVKLDAKPCDVKTECKHPAFK